MNDQHRISKENLLRVFPPYLATDERQYSLAKLTAEELEARAEETKLAAIYQNIDALPEWALDRLAYDFKVDWYDPEYTIEEKRATIKSAWRVHRILGTKAAVEEAISAIYPKTKVEEWFQYGGQPYHFKLLIDVTYERVDPEKHRRVLERARYYKPLRSTMDGVSYEARPSGRATVYVGTKMGSVHMQIGTRVSLNGLVK